MGRFDTSGLRRTGDQEWVPWRASTITLIWVEVTGRISQAQRIEDKRRVLREAGDAHCLLLAWRGQYRQGHLRNRRSRWRPGWDGTSFALAASGRSGDRHDQLLAVPHRDAQLFERWRLIDGCGKVLCGMRAPKRLYLRRQLRPSEREDSPR